MRALREKVAPRKEDEDKKETERKKVEGTRDVMALEQLVEANGKDKE
jgi:hypothetical protein